MGSSTPTTGTISGTVTNASTSAAIAGATVGYSGGSTTTDAAGGYTLANVAAGTVSVTTSASGYTSQTQSVSVTAGNTTQHNVALVPQQSAIFTDGFESGNLSSWTTNGGLTVQSAIVRTGSFAAQGNTTTGNTYAKKTLPSSYTEAYARIYFNIVSMASQVNLLRLRTASDVSIGYLFVSTSGKLSLRSDAAAATTTSATSVATNG